MSGKNVFLNDDQVNHLNMYLAALQILKEHIALIMAKAAMTELYTKILDNTTTISNSAVKRVSYRSGTTNVKKDVKLSTIDEICVLMGLLYNYGQKAGRQDIIASCSVTPSDMKRMSYEVVFQKGKEIYNIANAELLNLVDYEITALTQADFLGMLDAYHDLISTSSAKMAKSKSTTQEIKDIFTQTSAYYDQMDNFMKKLKKSDPEFFNQYMAARTILDYGASHKTEEGTNPAEPPVQPPQ